MECSLRRSMWLTGFDSLVLGFEGPEPRGMHCITAVLNLGGGPLCIAPLSNPALNHSFPYLPYGLSLTHPFLFVMSSLTQVSFSDTMEMIGASLVNHLLTKVRCNHDER